MFFQHIQIFVHVGCFNSILENVKSGEIGK
jgi:hypothetical protein